MAWVRAASLVGWGAELPSCDHSKVVCVAEIVQWHRLLGLLPARTASLCWAWSIPGLQPEASCGQHGQFHSCNACARSPPGSACCSFECIEL